MKKTILLLIAALASLQIAGAQQTKGIAAAKSAVEVAQEAADNAKKNTKTATWLKLGQTLLDAYNAPAGSAWIGASRQELQLVAAGEKPLSSENVVLLGRNYVKDVYATKNYYFDENGALAIIEITQPVYPDVLERAAVAFAKAAELDPKGQKTKEIVAGQQSVYEKFLNDAYNYYGLGDFKKSSDYFECAYNVSMQAPLSKKDTSAIYNAAFTSWMGEKWDRAKVLFEKSIAEGYDGNDGEAFTKLSEICEKLGDKEGQKKWLEEGFVKYPQSQSLLVAFINYYIVSGEEPTELFALIEKAKANDPKNASFPYVEGNVRKQLGDWEGAEQAYRKAMEIDPSYAFGFIGFGILKYDQAVKIQGEADAELDNDKYNALIKKMNATLKECIAPFETAFNMVDDAEIKSGLAQYLKNTCYRFISEGDEYKAKYDKYAAAAAE